MTQAAIRKCLCASPSGEEDYANILSLKLAVNSKNYFQYFFKAAVNDKNGRKKYSGGGGMFLCRPYLIFCRHLLNGISLL
jgi:hypothetical protein